LDDKPDRADRRRLGRRACLVGALAGAFSGYFLQSVVLTVVTGSGSLNEPRIADAAILETLAGAAAGAIATSAVGFVIGERSAKR
jgi:hypothetical protein